MAILFELSRTGYQIAKLIPLRSVYLCTHAPMHTKYYAKI